MTTQIDDGFTAADVASRLRVSERTIQRRAAAGVIPCHRFGPLLRFTPDDLAAIVGRSAASRSAS